MDQLCALDSMFLDIESSDVQANIGGVSVLEGPPPQFGELLSYAEGALDALPRYRQRLHEMPFGLGRPIWVDDERFEIANHIVAANLGKRVTFERVQDFFADVMATHLDRERPLWKIHIVRGLPGGRWAILWTVHHALVDGIAATDLLGLLLSFDPDAAPAPVAPWQPRPEPVALRKVTTAVTAPAGPLKPIGDVRRALRNPEKAARMGAATARALVPIARSFIEPNDSPINGTIGAERRWRTAKLDLAQIKRAGKLHGGTVNDIVLAAMAEGLRHFMLARGENPAAARTRTLVPVSIRGEDEQGTGANRVSAVFVDLPLGEADPARRLALVREQMDRLKEAEGHSAAELLGEVANYLPSSLFAIGERVFWRLADTQRLFNTITTNVPGPQAPLYCMGRKMLSLHPYVMLNKDVRIATAIFSYDGGVYFGVTSDAVAVPDTQLVCDGIEAALARLADTPGGVVRRLPRDRRPARAATSGRASQRV